MAPTLPPASPSRGPTVFNGAAFTGAALNGPALNGAALDGAALESATLDGALNTASLNTVPPAAAPATTGPPVPTLPDLADDPSWYLHRPRLDELLDRLKGPSSRVLALWDAAGSGKTTVMSGWARRLRAAGLTVDWFTGADLRECRTAQDAWARLTADGADIHPPRFVVIDDLHLGDDPPPADSRWPSNPKLSELVDQMAGAGPGVRFIVSARYRPVAGTAPLEASGVLIECTDETLAFTLGETFELAAHHGVTLSHDDGAALWRHTAGWATGLALAVTWRRSDGDTLDLRRFDGDNRAVADYLAAEVVTGLAADDRDLLIHSAVAEVVPLDLAVAVTNRPDAGEVLERLARRNTLIGRQPDTVGGEDYRYHPILLAYLQAEGRRADAGMTAARHSLAAEWYSDRAEGAGALEQSLFAGEPQVVEEMLHRFGLTLTLTGKTDLVGRALGRLRGTPASPAALALRLLLDAPHFPAKRRTHQLFAAADASLLAVRASGPADPPADRGPADDGLAARWRAVLEILHALNADDHAEIDGLLLTLRSGATATARQEPAIDLLAATAEGRCLDRIGRAGEGEDILREVAESASVAGYDWLFLLACDLAATAAAHSGNWLHVAMLESRMASLMTGARAGDQVSGRALLYSTIARYERCQAVDAGTLDELTALAETGSDAGVSVPAQVLTLLTRLDSAPHSRATLDRLTLLMREVGTEHPRALSLCCVPLVEVSEALDGRAETQLAVRLVERVLGEESLEALLVRFMLVPPTRAGHPAEERLRNAAVEERRAWRGSTIVSAWIALAQVAEVSGRHVESDARLLRALRLASQFGSIRAFLGGGGQGIGLVKARLGRLGDLDDFARHILRCADDSHPAERVPAADRGLSSPVLTQREREVLRELPYHQPVAEIARKRNVSPNTVKTHLRNIYQKLEAKNRADAVAIAQDRGLL